MDSELINVDAVHTFDAPGYGRSFHGALLLWCHLGAQALS